MKFSVAMAMACSSAFGSSHREAPLITGTPKLDCSDFYMFRSYETGRSDYVTFVANYIPLQDSYGGPNYFSLDANALYEIHIDNDGDGIEDITLQFRFQNSSPNVTLDITGSGGDTKSVAVPVLAVGQITAGNTSALNYNQTYTVNVIKGPRRTGTATAIKNAADESTTFTKPMDNVGNKTFPDYNTYANSYIYNVSLPGTATTGKLFVGQRKDPFVVNLGETFDLINISTSPVGPADANKDSLAYKNVTSLIVELPKSFLLAAGGDKPIIGAWTTCSKIDGTGTNQVSRLGHPLVNEVVIGLKDKDAFNASEPKNDTQFLDYVTHPTLPAIIELLYGGIGVKAPTAIPRNDLVAVFLTGVENLNKNGSVGEMLRLNTSVAPIPAVDQNNLGVVAGDASGFPNGRRPGDDVVDIALRAVMGVLLPLADAPSGQLPFTDGATVNASMFLSAFPYINPPLPGSPNDNRVVVSLDAAASVNGPYKPAKATYNAATKSLETPISGDQQFFQSKSDSHVSLGATKVNAAENKASIKLNTP